MRKVKIIITILSVVSILVGCGLSNSDLEGTTYSYDLAPGFGAIKSISFMSDGKCESFSDTGSSATYLSTRSSGTWKIEGNNVKISGAGLTGEYEYSGNSLKSSKLTLSKNN